MLRHRLLSYIRRLLPPILCTRRAYIQLRVVLLVAVIFLGVQLMSALRGAFVHIHTEMDTDGELVILPKKFAVHHGAVCLDGSSPAYYYRQSVLPESRDWIIYLPGGGWCSQDAECLKRSRTALGSSLKTEMSRPFNGILTSDCDINPDFCQHHMVVLVYCDGGAFLGNRSVPLRVGSHDLYLRGAVVFDAVVDYLRAFTHFSHAHNIVLVGSSSSSLGAMIHADRLHSHLGSKVRSLRAILDGGLYLDVEDVSGVRTMRGIMKQLFELHGFHNSTSLKRCTETTMIEEWKCLFPEVFQKFISTPTFFISSLYDTWFRQNALKIACVIELCSNLYSQHVQNALTKILQNGQRILESKRDGVFFTSCPGDSFLTDPNLFLSALGDYSVQQGIREWIMGVGSSGSVVEVLKMSDVFRVCPTQSRDLLI